MTTETDFPAVSAPAPHHLRSSDGDLAVAFEWQGDRYAHRIELRGVACLSSQEGTAHHDWPASPAIQQLSTEMIAGKPTILGVGCCGTTHFSVSVQLDTEHESGSAIRFDWAARLSKPLRSEQIGSIASEDNGLAWLGSTYQSLVRQVAGSECMLVSIADADLTHGTGGLTHVQPMNFHESRTVQWSYRIVA